MKPIGGQGSVKLNKKSAHQSLQHHTSPSENSPPPSPSPSPSVSSPSLPSPSSPSLSPPSAAMMMVRRNRSATVLPLVLLGLAALVLTARSPFMSSPSSNQETSTVTSGLILMVFTVATKETEGLDRFERSATMYGIKTNVLGFGREWTGGDIMRSPGGGQKVNLFKEALDSMKSYDNLDKTVVLFTDSYDVVFTSGVDRILELFVSSTHRVLFSAEPFCWPNPQLESLYPLVSMGSGGSSGKRFLNSGGFIGFYHEVAEIVSNSHIKDTDDDQLFYTNIYLDPQLRHRLAIGLDHHSHLFQTLNGVKGEIELKFKSNGDSYVHNTISDTEPVIIHGNGPSKSWLNSLANYLAKSWSPIDGCITCPDIKTDPKHPDIMTGKEVDVLFGEDDSSHPTILIAIFITKPTPFMAEFFEDIDRLKYPKDRMSIIIYNRIQSHEKDVDKFIEMTSGRYTAVRSMDSLAATVEEWRARSLAIEECLIIGCDYYLSLDSEARLTNPLTLKMLMIQRKKVISPMLIRPGKLWSNFWGSLSSDGFYARSFDYIDLVKNTRRGTWNVPHVSQAYLIDGKVIQQGLSAANEPHHIRSSKGEDGASYSITPSDQVDRRKPFPSFRLEHNPSIDADMAFSQSLRESGVFIHVSNVIHFGHLVDPESYGQSHLHNDLYEIFTNQIEWERRYIHPNYTQAIDISVDMTSLDQVIQQPCPDVYWFPLVSDMFTQHLIEEMEHFGQWSSGQNQDERLAGGYENVPTRDIHMNQVGMEPQWLYFLQQYVRPIQEKIFTGYFHDPPKSIMNFVVRYRPDEQPFLRPHHDASTYTINIALNSPGVDYQGGGCHFLRYNCSVTNMRKGWSLIHPGRLTHYHEGLRVTKGTRYIMISFVDP